jgi:N4-gp56 family major capsid protein
MPGNAFTDTTSGSLGNYLVQTAYDQYVEFALRAQPLFRNVADKAPRQQAMPGSSVVLDLYNDMSPATSALSESTDPDAVAIGNTNQVTITLNEYGNAALVTRRLELFAFSDVDPAIANLVAFNMADSLDSVAQTELRNSTNTVREVSGALSGTASGAASGVTNTDTLKARDIRYTVAKLRTDKVVPRRGNLYWSAIHPEVSHDLRAETGMAAWRDPHSYSAPDAIWAGELGQFEGAFFIESPRCYNATDGASSARVFRTYIAGQQALAEAVVEEPHVVIGPVVDKLMRFRPIGWYGVLGFKLYRSAALYQILTTSSIDNS